MIQQRIEKILKELRTLQVRQAVELEGYRMKETAARGLQTADVSDWEPFDAGNVHWGGYRKYFWFVTDVTLPESFAGFPAYFTIATGAENGWDANNPQFYFYRDGQLVQGLDLNHRQAPLTDCANGGETFHIALLAYTSENRDFLKLETKAVSVDPLVKDLYYDLKVPLEVAALLEDGDDRKIELLAALSGAVNRLDLRCPESGAGARAFRDSVAEARQYLREELYGKLCRKDGPVVKCVGHSHIDVAWLWTLQVTREKTARTFSTMLELMRRYPEMIFMASTPQVYQFIRQDEPELYERVREAIRSGRWEAEGAMFLEADCNLTSGESLARQLLYGQEFFERELGGRCEILWLPDVFGYSAALPQLLRQSGVKYFMTTKISWNETDKFPFDTFRWRGIDGSEVLTHFIPASDYQRVMTSYFTTYNGNLNPSQIKGAWQRYQQKGLNGEVLFSYGFGDGGGGPTAEMLENGRRLAEGIPGCPRVEPSTARAFFRQLESGTAGKRDLPWWSGELYFEYHRGTYTSMARNKKYNRRGEFLLEEAEKLASLNLCRLGSDYPKEKIEAGWEVLMRNQFHDILPGSSIEEVYEESKAEYEALGDSCRALITDAFGTLCRAVDTPERAVLALNTSGVAVRAPVTAPLLPGEGVFSGEEPLAVQRLENGEALFVCDLPANGTRLLPRRPGASAEPETSLTVTPERIETPLYTLVFDEAMELTSLYDKRARREVLRPGERGNRLCAYEDKPAQYDAWDINAYYKEKSWPVTEVESVRVLETGPVRGSVEVRRRFLDSIIVQRIRVWRDLPQIDFETEIDWKQRDILLKAAFPVDVHAQEATFEIQYGNVTRPTHYNTSWDQARFESCAHKWADLSEDGYGVSLLNDCKFGHDIHDGVISLTLLKSAAYPNPEADKERHTFTYSLLPHQGGWREAGTVPAAYALNNPPRAAALEAQKGSLSADAVLAACGAPNVVVEAVKQAQDGDGLVLRAYECFGRRTRALVRTAKPPRGVEECNLLEDAGQAGTLADGGFWAEWRPYEIKTFRVRF